MRLWPKGSRSFHGFPTQIFKWSTDFQLSVDPSIILAWIGLEVFAIYLFNKSFFSVLQILLVSSLNLMSQQLAIVNQA